MPSYINRNSSAQPDSSELVRKNSFSKGLFDLTITSVAAQSNVAQNVKIPDAVVGDVLLAQPRIRYSTYLNHYSFISDVGIGTVVISNANPTQNINVTAGIWDYVVIKQGVAQ